MTLLAAGYALTAIYQIVCGGAMVLYTQQLKIIGALRCFIAAAAAHVCQTAAVAGPKRLSSETYRTINLALALDGASSLAMMISIASSASAPFWTMALVSFCPAVGLASAVAGWTTGKLYR